MLKCNRRIPILTYTYPKSAKPVETSASAVNGKTEVSIKITLIEKVEGKRKF